MNAVVMNNVLLLNADYTPLGVISWRKAVRLMAKGKVEVVKHSNTVLYNMERTVKFVLPAILRLIKFIRSIFKNKVPFNKRNVLLRDNFTCAYCGKRSLTKMSLDHIVPRSKGGKSTFENTVTCCVPCNHKKDSKSCKEANMWPRFVKPIQPTIMEFILVQIRKMGMEPALKELGFFK